ncbi:hypothetical protein D9758_000726 [Tetrapyrgos nigripes]|uniref:TPR-like protein n=1 Tax=Tetrapyrgos nigripes TaxID=182062 RepID=A0A8H5GYT2_9AGAR|nr:hypothetical protein D9758_000726 [Tetrapyrgos nigripes]
MSQAQQVAQLKHDALLLSEKQEYEKAGQLYTKAMKLDNNADLWFNRAICRYNLKQYVGAAYDAAKVRLTAVFSAHPTHTYLQATNLDPKHTEAWVRLGLAYDALKQPWNSLPAWTQVSALLDKDTLSQTEQDLKTEYGGRMAEVSNAMANPPIKYTGLIAGKRRSASDPWLSALAASLRSGADSSEKRSSGLVFHAYREFVKGLEMLGPEMVPGDIETEQTNAIIHPFKSTVEQLSDAVLLHFGIISHFLNKSPTEKKEFKRRALLQVKAEARVVGVSLWVDGKDIDVIKKEARRRLQKEGWKNGSKWTVGLSSALTTTIHCWLLRAFILGDLFIQGNLTDRDSEQEETELFNLAVELIKWVRKEWSGVSVDDRGKVFELTFLNMVESKYLSAITKSPQHRRDLKERKSLASQVHDRCDQLIRSIDLQLSQKKLGTEDPNLKVSYYDVPKAWAMLEEDDGRVRTTREDIQITIDSANCIPKDDELHIRFLNLACRLLETFDGTTFQEMIDLSEQFNQALDSMLPIWLAPVQDHFQVDEYNDAVKLKKKALDRLEKAHKVLNELKDDGKPEDFLDKPMSEVAADVLKQKLISLALNDMLCGGTFSVFSIVNEDEELQGLVNYMAARESGAASA